MSGRAMTCWGDNRRGELGAGHADPIGRHEHPDLGGEIREVACFDGCCALVDDTLMCWGDEESALPEAQAEALGSPGVPHVAARLSEQVRGFSLSRYGGCAIRDDQLLCWGDNRAELAGAPDQGDWIARAASVPLPAGDIEQVQCGGTEHRHTCALVDGLVYCWGMDQSGEVGANERLADALTPQPAGLRLTGNHVHLELGVGLPSCLVVDGRVECWGGPGEPMTGVGDRLEARFRLEPRVAPGLGSGVAQLLLRGDRALVLRKDGSAVRLPEGDLTDLGPARLIAASPTHACALSSNDDSVVRCAGDGISGQLGNGKNFTPGRTTEVVGLSGKKVTALAAAAIETPNPYGGRPYVHGSTCAIVDGGVQCWGFIVGERPEPTTIEPLRAGAGVVGLALGESQGCAVDAQGDLYCWDAVARNAPPPTARRVLSDVQVVRASSRHFCASTRARALYCWGSNEHGQLGLGDRAPRATPTRVPGVSVHADRFGLAADDGGSTPVTRGAEATTCAQVAADGEVLCWGSNGNRQRAVADWFVRTPTLILPWSEVEAETAP
jgi:hypothetical protein